MMRLFAILVLGFFLGMRHATDPDHVIAISTIVSRQRTVRQAALIGILWGLGHTLTIFVVGVVIILFSVVIPPRIGLTMELSVAVMLILLGVLNLTGIMRWINEVLVPGHGPVIHSHPHSHGDYVHNHYHMHGRSGQGSGVGERIETIPDFRPPSPGPWLARLGLYQVLRPLIVGVVHGLAGSAAVALLVLTTIQNPIWAAAYLLIFGFGTIAGMMLITAAIALPFAYTGGRLARINRHLGWASGVISLGFGLFLTYQIGFVDGLFTRHPRWTPH